jgi:hypothetical protein
MRGLSRTMACGAVPACAGVGGLTDADGIKYCMRDQKDSMWSNEGRLDCYRVTTHTVVGNDVYTASVAGEGRGVELHSGASTKIAENDNTHALARAPCGAYSTTGSA